MDGVLNTKVLITDPDTYSVWNGTFTETLCSGSHGTVATPNANDKRANYTVAHGPYEISFTLKSDQSDPSLYTAPDSASTASMRFTPRPVSIWGFHRGPGRDATTGFPNSTNTDGVFTYNNELLTYGSVDDYVLWATKIDVALESDYTKAGYLNNGLIYGDSFSSGTSNILGSPLQAVTKYYDLTSKTVKDNPLSIPMTQPVFTEVVDALNYNVTAYPGSISIQRAKLDLSVVDQLVVSNVAATPFLVKTNGWAAGDENRVVNGVKTIVVATNNAPIQLICERLSTARVGTFWFITNKYQERLTGVAIPTQPIDAGVPHPNYFHLLTNYSEQTGAQDYAAPYSFYVAGPLGTNYYVTVSQAHGVLSVTGIKPQVNWAPTDLTYGQDFSDQNIKNAHVFVAGVEDTEASHYTYRVQKIVASQPKTDTYKDVDYVDPFATGYHPDAWTNLSVWMHWKSSKPEVYSDWDELRTVNVAKANMFILASGADMLNGDPTPADWGISLSTNGIVLGDPLWPNDSANPGLNDPAGKAGRPPILSARPTVAKNVTSKVKDAANPGTMNVAPGTYPVTIIVGNVDNSIGTSSNYLVNAINGTIKVKGQTTTAGLLTYSDSTTKGWQYTNEHKAYNIQRTYGYHYSKKDMVNVLRSFGSPLFGSPFGTGDYLPADDFSAIDGLISDLVAHTDPVSLYLWTAFGTDRQNILKSTTALPSDKRSTLISGLNEVLGGASIYDATRFAGITLRTGTIALRDQTPAATGNDLAILNRMLIEDAYPTRIAIKSYANKLVPAPGTVNDDQFEVKIGGAAYDDGIVLQVATNEIVWTYTAGPAYEGFKLTNRLEVLPYPINLLIRWDYNMSWPRLGSSFTGARLVSGHAVTNRSYGDDVNLFPDLTWNMTNFSTSLRADIATPTALAAFNNMASFDTAGLSPNAKTSYLTDSNTPSTLVVLTNLEKTPTNLWFALPSETIADLGLTLAADATASSTAWKAYPVIVKMNADKAKNYTINVLNEKADSAVKGLLGVTAGLTSLAAYTTPHIYVTNATLQVRVQDTQRPYGQPNPDLTPYAGAWALRSDGVTWVLNADGITVQPNTTANQTSPAGDYPITGTLFDPNFAIGNYADHPAAGVASKSPDTWTDATGTLTVTPAELIATPVSKSTGLPNILVRLNQKTLSYVNQISGLTNDDTISVITTQPTWGVAIPASATVGSSYQITNWIAGATAKNVNGLYNYKWTYGPSLATVAANQPPTARPDSITVSQGSMAKILVSKLLANDSSPFGDTLTLQFADFPKLSTNNVPVDKDNTKLWLYYNTDARTLPTGTNYDIFTYRVQDLALAYATGVVYVKVSVQTTNYVPNNIRSAERDPVTGAITLTFLGIEDRIYQVQGSPDIVKGPWTDLFLYDRNVFPSLTAAGVHTTNRFTCVNSQIIATDTNAAAGGQFYRAITPQQ